MVCLKEALGSVATSIEVNSKRPKKTTILYEIGDHNEI